MNKAWQKTKIWEKISEKVSQDNKEIISFLDNTLKNVCLLLDRANTSPATFTLHDSGHSFRVAERMAELIPKKTFNSLSIYELALLLLSAYLHDIGMTPPGNKVNHHCDYLLTGESKCLSDNEKDKFDIWLSSEERNIKAPLNEGNVTSNTTSKARELTAYYFRDIHNEASREWIEKNIIDDKLLNCDNFRTDLIALCQSHHWDIDKLEDKKYNIKRTNDGLFINLKFLFCILRLGDILENDPERTPKIIFEHREVFPSSEIFWYRDQSLKIKLRNRNGFKELYIYARPKKALIHKAIYELVESIKNEIEICSKLLLNRKSDSYSWNLILPIKKDIEPFRKTYTYIKGKFRINIEKTLRLLGGIELYKDLGIAIRELLQNSFDAVKQQIALEQIEYLKNNIPYKIDEIRNSHLVKLTFKYENDNVYLECFDDGVGMTKAIIENSLLFIGEKNRPDVTRLINICEKFDIKLDLSSQFGIGFLSYFMIADEIKIETKRNTLCNDKEDTGWTFTINGIGEWGELKKKKLDKPGTTICLKLKTYALRYLDIYNSIFNFKSSYFIDYISNMFNYLPCKFQMCSKYSNDIFINYPPEWTPNTELKKLKINNDASNFILSLKKINDISNQYLILSEEENKKYEKFKEEAQYLIEEIKNRESFDTYEGKLPNNLGRYRIFIPKYSISKEDTEFFFLEQNEDEGKNSVQKKYKAIKDANENEYEGYRQYGSIIISYCGFKIEKCDIFNKYAKYGFFIFDFNNEKHCQLSIDKTILSLSQEAQSIIENYIDQLFEKRMRSIYENKLSSFHFINLLFYNKHEDNPNNVWWINYKDKLFTFEKLQFPATHISEIDNYQSSTTKKYKINNDNISIVPKVIIGTSKCQERFDTENQIILNCFQSLDPSEIIYLKDYNDIKLCCLWTTMKKQYAQDISSCDFPANWREIVYISMPSGLRIWNRSFPFYKEIIEQQITNRWELINILIKNNFDFGSFPENYFNNTNACIKWLSTYVDLYAMSGWAPLNAHSSFFSTLFHSLNINLKDKLEKIIAVSFAKNYFSSEKLVLSLLQIDGFKIIKNKDKILEIMKIQDNCKELKIIKDNSNNSLLSSFLTNFQQK